MFWLWQSAIIMIEMDEQIDVPSTGWGGQSSLHRRRSITSTGPAGALRDESHSLGARKKVRILHPRKETEQFSILTMKGCGLHVIKDADVSKHLPNTLRRPGMKWEALDANLDMERLGIRPSIGLKAPRMDKERGGTNIE
jgi:hypothetical protein